MTEAELTHTFGDNVDQELLIGNNCGGFLEELSCHRARGSGGAARLRREIDNCRLGRGQAGRYEARSEHVGVEKRAVTVRARRGVVNPLCTEVAAEALTNRVG